jgi:hypothetical protein
MLYIRCKIYVIDKEWTLESSAVWKQGEARIQDNMDRANAN